MPVVGAIINGLLVLLLAPLFDGVMRKLKAVIHSRQGPPFTQPYRDLLKLLGKEDLRPVASVVFRAAPIVSLAALLVAVALMPIGTNTALGSYGDAIVWIYVLSVSAVALILGAFASGNPFAYAGAGREMMMMLTVEPIVVLAILAGMVKAKTLLFGGLVEWQLANGATVSMTVAAIAFFLALQANVGRLPFDIVEAESEIVEGPFIEYSGPRLALCKLGFYVRQLMFALLFVSVFIPWPRVDIAALAVVLALVKALVVLLVVGLIDCVVPRLRIDQSMTYMSRVLFVALGAVALALIGV
ncbi:MAG: respiratory chain complex I subunit 1 family protein [Armatimonadota bacterium]